MNDDSLILYYYEDGLDDAERARVATALARDPALAERYRALCHSLERFAEPPAVQAPAAAVARWHRSIDRAAGMESGATRGSNPGRNRRWHFPSFAWGALAAVIVLGIAVRLWFGNTEAPLTSAPQEEMIADDGSPALRAVPVSFSRGLAVHLRDSRQDLLRLAEDGDADRRDLLRDIVRQNRQFERAALDNNAEDVARVLRAFEPILLQLANEDLSEEDAAALKSKLLFELNVMLTKMSAGESQDAQTIQSTI